LSWDIQTCLWLPPLVVRVTSPALRWDIPNVFLVVSQDYLLQFTWLTMKPWLIGTWGLTRA